MAHYYILERHVDGVWWYHGSMYDTLEEAKKALEEWKKDYGDRPWTLVAHPDLLPKETLYTKDFHEFRTISGIPYYLL